jgi:O-acetyl-ADP-ribose deacetylase (regulator of RNase III)
MRNFSESVSQRVAVERGNLVAVRVDAIVNAANSSLLGGGGVDGAIHHAAGPGLLEACRKLHGCKAGDAKITHGYRLPARYVIHTVGPVWHGGRQGEARTLASCYRRSLGIAVEQDIRTIAFPAISCGAYGYPLDDAAAIAVFEVATFLDQDDRLETVYFVCFSDDVFDAYRRALERTGA